jgi:hypothetical protein
MLPEPLSLAGATVASLALAVSLAAALAAAAPAGAQSPPPASPPPAPAEPTAPDLPWLDNEWYKVHLDARARIGLANIDGFAGSQAYTLRTRAGLGSKPWHGLSAFAELENTWSLADDEYFDGVSSRTGKSIIADPGNTELNRAWAQYESAALFGSPVSAKAKGGLQRIIFDDARFIGNVGWRQNEQTFRAAFGQSNLGVDALSAQYAYLWYIQRIFGDKGPTAATRDFDSDSHLARVSYTGIAGHELTAFTYLLDFQNDSPTNSANSYGLRAAGSFGLGEKLALGYSASYAYQTDAASNPLDYEAHYAWAHLDLGQQGLGVVGVTYELLGSDDGNAVFVTPLATAHKFNGYADVFLNNGGPQGLQDLYLSVAPALPWMLKGQLDYHEFWQAEGGDHLGREVDVVLGRPINRTLSVLSKWAWFDGDDAQAPADRWRISFELEFKY